MIEWLNLYLKRPEIASLSPDFSDMYNGTIDVIKPPHEASARFWLKY